MTLPSPWIPGSCFQPAHMYSHAVTCMSLLSRATAFTHKPGCFLQEKNKSPVLSLESLPGMEPPVHFGHCHCLSENPMQKYLPNMPPKSHGFGNGSVLPEARYGDWQAAGTVQKHICMSGSYSFLHTSLIKSGLPKAGIFTPVSLSRYLPPPVCVLQTEGVKCSLILSLCGELELPSRMGFLTPLEQAVCGCWPGLHGISPSLYLGCCSVIFLLPSCSLWVPSCSLWAPSCVLGHLLWCFLVLPDHILAADLSCAGFSPGVAVVQF